MVWFISKIDLFYIKLKLSNLRLFVCIQYNFIVIVIVSCDVKLDVCNFCMLEQQRVSTSAIHSDDIFNTL